MRWPRRRGVAAGEGARQQLAPGPDLVEPEVHREPGGPLLDPGLHQPLGADVRPAREPDRPGRQPLARIGQEAPRIEHLEEAAAGQVGADHLGGLGGGAGVPVGEERRHGDGEGVEVGRVHHHPGALGARPGGEGEGEAGGGEAIEAHGIPFFRFRS
jgi:hypothetical protein